MVSEIAAVAPPVKSQQKHSAKSGRALGVSLTASKLAGPSIANSTMRSTAALGTSVPNASFAGSISKRSQQYHEGTLPPSRPDAIQTHLQRLKASARLEESTSNAKIGATLRAVAARRVELLQELESCTAAAATARSAMARDASNTRTVESVLRSIKEEDQLFSLEAAIEVPRVSGIDRKIRAAMAETTQLKAAINARAAREKQRRAERVAAQSRETAQRRQRGEAMARRRARIARVNEAEERLAAVRKACEVEIRGIKASAASTAASDEDYMASMAAEMRHIEELLGRRVSSPHEEITHDTAHDSSSSVRCVAPRRSASPPAISSAERELAVRTAELGDVAKRIAALKRSIASQTTSTEAAAIARADLVSRDSTLKKAALAAVNCHQEAALGPAMEMISPHLTVDLGSSIAPPGIETAVMPSEGSNPQDDGKDWAREILDDRAGILDVGLLEVPPVPVGAPQCLVDLAAALKEAVDGLQESAKISAADIDSVLTALDCAREESRAMLDAAAAVLAKEMEKLQDIDAVHMEVSEQHLSRWDEPYYLTTKQHRSSGTTARRTFLSPKCATKAQSSQGPNVAPSRDAHSEGPHRYDCISISSYESHLAMKARSAVIGASCDKRARNPSSHPFLDEEHSPPTIRPPKPSFYNSFSAEGPLDAAIDETEGFSEPSEWVSIDTNAIKVTPCAEKNARTPSLSSTIQSSRQREKSASILYASPSQRTGRIQAGAFSPGSGFSSSASSQTFIARALAAEK